MSKLAFLWAASLALVYAQAALADSCRFNATRTAAIEGGPVRKVIVIAGAGDLIVRSDKTLTAPRASGRACASSQKQLDAITLETHREGDTLYIKTVLPEIGDSFSFGQNVSLDLTVDLPQVIATEIEDSSGDAEISDIGAAIVTDSSGDLRLNEIHGDLSITDSSGGIRIDSVAGNVQIRDSSGDVDVADVTGNLDIPLDSSGDLRLSRVGGNVIIGTDSSGDIVVQQVQRDVTIGRDSSGDISVTDVAGNLSIGADSSGDIDHDRVLGKMDLPRGHR